MKILDRYIGKTVVSNVMLTLFLLVALAGFFSFLGQLRHAHGGSEFENLLNVFKFVGLSLPRWAYELFAPSVLIGALFGLGSLATHSELIVMRASGVSIQRISFSVFKVGLLLMVFAFVLGDVIAPMAEQAKRGIYSSDKSNYVGLWARDDNNYIKVDRVNLSLMKIEGLLIYKFGKDRQLAYVVQAETAQYIKGLWQLENVQQSVITNNKVTIHKYKKDSWKKLIDPGLLGVLASAPKNLAVNSSVWSLLKFSKHMERHHSDASRYKLAFWSKIFKPLSTMVMLLIAIPFIFGSIRTTNSGQRLMIGVLVGMGFVMIDKGLNNMGLAYGYPAIISAGAPSVLFALIGLYYIRRLN
ncbi:Lipopolysaccharide export system permease protein LptG [hydrothermal vent metagenome]|uniref:Lipopolysaccharide export system permease protein LptG n=1 Tax=hydrothermal vent metagenome TaxID=652676 RepID=A0A3B0YC72_9ZZZZ